VEAPVTKDPSQSWLTREQLNRLIERTQRFSRYARTVAGDVVINGVEVGKRCARAQSDAALAPRPAGASGQPTTTAPDHPVDIKFTGQSGVEALLDFRPQPGKLLGATLLVQDGCDDCGFAATICALAHLRGHEFFESGGQF
jgi:hypothetical protein